MYALRTSIFILLLFTICAGFSFDNQVYAGLTDEQVETVKNVQLEKYRGYRLVKETTDGNLKTWVYTRIAEEPEPGSNLCGIYVVVAKEYTLEIQINKENKQVYSKETSEEFSRNTINGLA